MDPPFGLYISYPRDVLPLQVGTLQTLGAKLQSGTLLIIERAAINFDPLHLFKEFLPTEVRFVATLIL